MRSDGKSIAEIARTEISPKARLLFSVFIWISVVLVIAVFAIFASKTFIAEPDAVVPSFGLIPAALLVGWLMYRKRVNSKWVTALGLALLAVLLWGGVKIPVVLESIGGFEPKNIWIIVLLVYCVVASTTPVQTLLQPRDYLASFILFAAIGMGVAGVLLTQPDLTQRAYRGFSSAEWPASGALWPMLFVTIACGAISGFHSLVSSGTTCKQIASETQACRVGYGGMLMEGFVGILVIICVSAGLSNLQLNQALRSGGPIAAFSQGYGAIAQPLLGDYGRPFAVMALNAFILTTLDTATRIARYLTTELFGVRNKYLSALIVVAAGGALALTGQWTKLWPAFGASNQLIAGLALLVATCWLMHRGRPIWYTLIPSVLMLATTIGAFVYQFFSAVNREVNGSASPDILIAVISLVLVALSGVIAFDAWKQLSAKLVERSGASGG